MSTTRNRKVASKAVAKKDEGGVPAYLKDVNTNNQDNFDSNDVVVPQIRLLQATHDEITTFDNARVGEFWHTGLDEPLGNEITFVPVLRKKYHLLMAPMVDGRKILARADDARTWDRLGAWDVKMDAKGKRTVPWAITPENRIITAENPGLTGWGTSDPDDEDSPPAATMFYRYLVILPDHLDLGPAVMLLARSAIKKAKRGLNDKISMHSSAGRPMQCLKFSAKSIDDTNDSGQDYKNWSFRSAGYADEDVFNYAMRLSEELKEFKVADETGAADFGDRDEDPAADAPY